MDEASSSVIQNIAKDAQYYSTIPNLHRLNYLYHFQHHQFVSIETHIHRNCEKITPFALGRYGSLITPKLPVQCPSITFKIFQYRLYQQRQIQSKWKTPFYKRMQLLVRRLSCFQKRYPKLPATHQRIELPPKTRHQ